MPAKKIEAFSNGAQYVAAGGWAQFFAWLIDFVVFAFGAGVGVVVLAAVDRSQGLGNGVVALGMLILLFGVPLLYGLFYTNGRALGGLIAGTRLVRLRDGGPIGAKGPWAMLIRTILLPLLFVAIVFGGGNVGGSLRRGSIDIERTRQLYEQGHPTPH